MTAGDGKEPTRLFKKLTSENWREIDDTSSPFVRTNADGSVEKLTADDWAATILRSQLSANVPGNVGELFEVARGALCYGCFFYPLYTLGCEQLYRVQEAALKDKCTQMGASKRLNTFGKMVDWMKEKGEFSEGRFRQWKATRQLRNSSSHATKQSIYDPTMAVWHTSVAVELINELFEDPGEA